MVAVGDDAGVDELMGVGRDGSEVVSSEWAAAIEAIN